MFKTNNKDKDSREETVSQSKPSGYQLAFKKLYYISK